MNIRKTKQESGSVPGYIALPIWIAFALGFYWMDWIANACIQIYAWLFNLDCSKNPVFDCLLIPDADKEYFARGIGVILIVAGVLGLLGIAAFWLRKIWFGRKRWMAQMTCLMRGHRWVKHGRYEYILSDSTHHAYQCERCDKVRSSRFPIH
ncbi:hypothetical protein [Burkholderia cenocepacia]|uniref:hypothetical protein n=1 Tax=Burkholderia cenocepacia TaxID=95486 RepID=UPI00222FBD5F|nr:hypothetical protein [Burkholderia cenocepacia]MCW3632817.1 hypothetical protein [Burkholderia cenocepacia]MCW5182402.1 hypothetical protein [Burkholderia cenocepacia]